MWVGIILLAVLVFCIWGLIGSIRQGSWGRLKQPPRRRGSRRIRKHDSSRHPGWRSGQIRAQRQIKRWIGFSYYPHPARWISKF